MQSALLHSSAAGSTATAASSISSTKVANLLLRHLLSQNSGSGSSVRSPVTLSFAAGAGINAHYPSSVVQSLLYRLKLILLNNVQTPVQPALTLQPANSPPPTSSSNTSSGNTSGNGKTTQPAANTPFSHFQSQQSQTSSFLFNLFNINTTFPFLLSLGSNNNASSMTSSATTLHLITAYSGYSKDYLNNTFNTNIKRTDCMQQQQRGGKKKKGGVIGDDAWFITRQPAVDVLGVADGVGGWHSYGIDPSKFSFSLMKTCKRIVEQDFDIPTQTNSSTSKTTTGGGGNKASSSRRTASTTTLNSSQRPRAGNNSTSRRGNYKYCEVNTTTPLSLLEESYRTLLENKNSNLLVGSSTACILIFHHETSLLHSCNLGDSGFVIVRDGSIIHRSQEQQHYFNSPYQIAILPNLQRLGDNQQAEEVLVVNNNNNQQEENSLINDSPESATSSTVELKEGDFIVVGTDGLWDNLTESHLLIEIAQIKSFLIEDLEKAANRIARKAIELALDPDYVSPFAQAAQKYGINLSGGKPDDITVLLARVSR